MEKYLVGYTAGVYDLFHVGHLNVIKNAKSLCDKLVVGVSTDELASNKGKIPIIPFKERLEIVSSIKYVDCAIPQDSFDKYEMWEKIKFNILFVGDDWFKDKKWDEYENKLKLVGVKIIFFPYTKGVSSTILREKIK